MPAKLLPPPVQPMMWVGVSPAISIWSSASSPMIVWCSSTWLSTEPSAYLLPGLLTTASIASEIAMPRLPWLSGSAARMSRPVLVRSDGLATTSPPQVCIIRRR